MERIFSVFVAVSFVLASFCKGSSEPNIDTRIDSILNYIREQSSDHVHLERKIEDVLQELRNRRTMEELDALKLRLENLEKELQNEKSFSEVSESELAKVKATFKNALDTFKSRIPSVTGSTYIRWGRTSCSNNGSLTIYDGFAAGGHYTHKGTSVSMLCLPRDPVWGKYDDSLNSYGDYVYGVEYEHDTSRASAIFGRSYHNLDVPCAACESERSSHIMIPGRTTCYDGWTREYWGYLMAGHYRHTAQGDFHCVDSEPENVEGGADNSNGYLLYFVEVRCDALRCPPYVKGRELPCVVCTK